MSNPWTSIDLELYEKHMSLDSVLQLQTMNKIMFDQLYHYNISSVMILGIAGGNGLEHINPERFQKVYGVDINETYLEKCVIRYPKLQSIFSPIQCDLQTTTAKLPPADLIIANLLIEYIGYTKFKETILQVKPRYVSCIIQINLNEDFISASPYLHIFESLEQVHHIIEENELISAMQEIEYALVYKIHQGLPNGKALLRLDFINYNFQITGPESDRTLSGPA